MGLENKLKLNNGNTIPQIGFGTWELTGKTCYDSVKFALESGIRHIDTASMYENEEDVGRAIRDSQLPREELFITSKVWIDEQGYDDTFAAYSRSLKKLGLDYLDLYLVHWPAKKTRLDTYRALEVLYKDKKVKNIGVSNYILEHLTELEKHAEITPAVNQLELHPFDYGLRKATIDYCFKKGIVVEAYRPLVKAKKNADPTLQRIAGKHDVSVAQVLIRWSLQKSFVVIPRSANPKHIRQNIDVFGFELKDEEIAQLDSLNENLSSTRFSPEDFL